MASLTKRNELITNFGGNRIRVTANIDVIPSATEDRLSIPKFV